MAGGVAVAFVWHSGTWLINSQCWSLPGGLTSPVVPKCLLRYGHSGPSGEEKWGVVGFAYGASALDPRYWPWL